MSYSMDYMPELDMYKHTAVIHKDGVEHEMLRYNVDIKLNDTMKARMFKELQSYVDDK